MTLSVQNSGNSAQRKDSLIEASNEAMAHQEEFGGKAAQIIEDAFIKAVEMHPAVIVFSNPEIFNALKEAFPPIAPALNLGRKVYQASTLLIKQLFPAL